LNPKKSRSKNHNYLIILASHHFLPQAVEQHSLGAMIDSGSSQDLPLLTVLARHRFLHQYNTD
jgi:hypothetical protein